MSTIDKPPLIIVGGSPASGKSTLAEWLAAEFHLPLLTRDAFKESLMDTLGSPDADASHRLGEAAYAILRILQDRLLTAGVGVVLESNFLRGVSEDDLRPAVAHSRAVALYCHTTLEESKRRFTERAERGDRHPGHHDDEPGKLDELEAAIVSGCYDPLDLPIPHLVIDTTDPDAIDRAAIAAFVRANAIVPR
jgi:predicted kinase